VHINGSSYVLHGQSAGSAAYKYSQHFRYYSTNSHGKSPSFQWTPDISSRGFAKVPSPIGQDKSFAADIQSFLRRQGIKFIDGHTCFSITCPRYKNLKSDTDRLFVNKTTGEITFMHSTSFSCL
jgi:hypothetical protein